MSSACGPRIGHNCSRRTCDFSVSSIPPAGAGMPQRKRLAFDQLRPTCCPTERMSVGYRKGRAHKQPGLREPLLFAHGRSYHRMPGRQPQVSAGAECQHTHGP